MIVFASRDSLHRPQQELIRMPSLSEKRAKLLEEIEPLKPSEIDPHSNIHGVLLSDEIDFYVGQFKMIDPFVPQRLKAAGYELTVGDEYFLGGEYLTLGDRSSDKKRVTIPPFEVAVIKTKEIIRLPRYIIARWNIKVSHAYSGLLWVGGPQVDPGWSGHLFCPIYNLSDKAVTLDVGEPIALMDFVKTTPFQKGVSKEYNFPPKRLILEEYGIDDLRSALFTTAGKKLQEFEEEINKLGTRFMTYTQISFAIFALVISLVAISSKVGAENIALSTSIWSGITIFASVAAVLIAIFSYVDKRVGRLVYEQYGKILGSRAAEGKRFLRKAWLAGISLSMLFAIAGGWAAYQAVYPSVKDLRQQRVITKSDLDGMGANVSANLDQLAARVDRIENSRLATIDDLEKMRTTLDMKIQALKSRSRKTD